MEKAQGAVSDGHLPECRWSWDGTPCACLGLKRVDGGFGAVLVMTKPKPETWRDIEPWGFEVNRNNHGWRWSHGQVFMPIRESISTDGKAWNRVYR